MRYAAFFRNVNLGHPNSPSRQQLESAFSTAGADDPLPLVVGVGVGSMAWFTVLSSCASVARRRVGRRTVQIVDVVSGAGILGFAGVLGYKTLR